MRIPHVLRIHSFCEKTFVTGMSVCRTTLLIPILYHPHPLHCPVLIIWIIVITSGVDRIGWRKGKDWTGCRWWLCIYIRRIGSISLCFVCVSALPLALCEAIWINEDRPWKLFSTPILMGSRDVCWRCVYCVGGCVDEENYNFIWIIIIIITRHGHILFSCKASLIWTRNK